MLAIASEDGEESVGRRRAPERACLSRRWRRCAGRGYESAGREAAIGPDRCKIGEVDDFARVVIAKIGPRVRPNEPVGGHVGDANVVPSARPRRTRDLAPGVVQDVIHLVQAAVDPVQLYISIAALCFFYLSNSATLSVIFGRDLLTKEAKDERLAHMVALVLAALTGKPAAAFAKDKAARVRAPAEHTI